MKIELYKPLFWTVDKDWWKRYKNFVKLYKIIKNLPKWFTDIQILTYKIAYQWQEEFKTIEKIKPKEEYKFLQDFYKEHDFIYNFFILNKELKKNFIDAVNLFNFLETWLSKNDYKNILNKINSKFDEYKKEKKIDIVVDDIVNTIINIIKFPSKENKDIENNLYYSIPINDILELPHNILSDENKTILYLMLAEKFNIISSKNKDTLKSEKVQEIIKKNWYLKKYLNLFEEYNKDTKEVIFKIKDFWINIMEYYLRWMVYNTIWLLYQEEIFYNNELKVLDTEKEYVFSFSMSNKWQTDFYRWEASWENNQLIFTIRKVWKPLDLDEKIFLFTPDILKNNIKRVFHATQWLIVIAGWTWSGKTTFLMSILEDLNRNDKRNRLVYTAEDPIEYRFSPKQYEFIQKQVGDSADINSMADWVRIALRSKPNIIFIGETRDFETAKNLLAAAETWHLTLTTMHLNNPRDVLTRLINLTDTEKSLIQDQLSKNLTAVINLKLIKVRIKDPVTWEEQKTILPYFSYLIPDEQVRILLAEWNSKNIIALFTEYERIISWTVWPKELTLLHYYKEWLITKEQLKLLSDEFILNQVYHIYDQIFVKKVY